MENESVVYKKLSDYKCEKYNGSNKTSLDIKLSSAVNFGKIDEVGELLACGANPKKEDASYGTILHKAAAQKSLNVVMLLAQAGANLNAVDKNGKTPVEVAKDQKIKEYLENAAKAKKEEENNRKAFEWYPSGSAPSLYPTELFFGDFIFSNGARLYIPKSIPFAADWGQSSGAMHILEDNEFPAPSKLDMIWFSYVENKFYSIETDLPEQEIRKLLLEKDDNGNQKYNFIVAGMAPYGGVALWAQGRDTKEIGWYKATEENVPAEDFFAQGNYSGTITDYRNAVLKEQKNAYENFQKNGLPPKDLYDNYMKRYNYGISVSFKKNVDVSKNTDLRFYNGEIFENKSWEELKKPNTYAKLKKIIIHWQDGQDKWDAYFWTKEEEIKKAFEKAYGNDANQEGSLEIEIGNDSEDGLDFSFFIKTKNGRFDIDESGIMENYTFKNDIGKFAVNYNRPEGGFRN